MLVICSLLAALSLSQAPAADQPGRISGRVTAEGANTPIAGARVILIPTTRPTAPFGPPPQALTDPDGRYTFDGVAPGTYRLDIQRTGFAPLLQPMGQTRADTIQVAAGQRLDGVDRQLQKGAVIAGRILDANGEPLPDVRIMVMRRIAPMGRGAGPGPRLIPAGGQSQQTNDLGEFRVSGLAPGEYFVAAMPQAAVMFGGPGMNVPSVPRRPRGGHTTVATTFYPGTTDQVAAQAVTVAAGAEAGNINFAMQSAPAFRVSGVVVDENGSPVAGAMVMLMGDPRGGTMFMGPGGGARTRDDGRFDIDDVVAGTYHANASIPVTMSSNGSAAMTWSSSAGSGVSGVVAGSSVTAGVSGGVVGGGSVVTYGDASISGARDQAAEVIVGGADVMDVRVVVRRPAPR